ncbi:Uncharacterised protein [Salmonella enterica]|uniref:Uncharacterized protein n=1 Tax=Salmonella enterica TaxID=28901 RepID=A0A379SDL1_SALER|nr:Uncharacterised protein [Salmonella enterica]
MSDYSEKHMVNQLACNSNMISLHDVFKICQNSGVLRLVKKDEDENIFALSFVVFIVFNKIK